MAAWSNLVVIISMDLLPIQPVEFNRSTGHEILVKLAGNSLRLHCMPAWSNWVSSLWIYTQFDQYFMSWSNSTGQISNLTGHEILVKMGVNSLRLHCMPAWSNWVSSQWIYNQFDQ